MLNSLWFRILQACRKCGLTTVEGVVKRGFSRNLFLLTAIARGYLSPGFDSRGWRNSGLHAESISPFWYLVGFDVAKR